MWLMENYLTESSCLLRGRLLCGWWRIIWLSLLVFFMVDCYVVDGELSDWVFLSSSWQTTMWLMENYLTESSCLLHGRLLCGWRRIIWLSLLVFFMVDYYVVEGELSDWVFLSSSWQTTMWLMENYLTESSCLLSGRLLCGWWRIIWLSLLVFVADYYVVDGELSDWVFLSSSW
jgi:hypothetical protein